jgi:hypothetical protein
MKIFLLLVLVAGFIYHIYKLEDKCSASGGQLVRGAVWFVCVKGQP